MADILPVAVATTGVEVEIPLGITGDRSDVVNSGVVISWSYECSILTQDIVEVAIEPVFANLRGRNNWMVACASVLARMAVRRRIAAEGAPARLAGAQMNPAITGLHAFFAFVTAWCLDATDRVDMSA